jgi:cell division protein FtsL
MTYLPAIFSSIISPIKLRYILIASLIFISALGVIYTAHLHRHLIIQSHNLTSDKEKLAIEYNKLLLEYSALTSPYRIEDIARTQLNMQLPLAATIVTIKQGE